ncbi:MAG: beta-N-acetylhexosaminidase [Parashewanella sp.]
MSYLMLDLEGTVLLDNEISLLQHPKVGGVILFSRNYDNKKQLIQLVKSIRHVRPELLIAVDHEGGRVQRFIKEFTHIPAMGAILPTANNDKQQAVKWARELGFLMAIELLACDIDLSFAPVLDINGISDVIGTRAFADEPQMVTLLSDAFIDGLTDAGMGAVGKHFPGHGSVQADSHIAISKDNRDKQAIFEQDMLPFKAHISNSKLRGIMPAHVIYSQLDDKPAGFSSFWLQDILRNELGFNGVIFSDDLGMKGASVAGDFLERAQAALTAGCDMILVCNNPDAVKLLLADFSWPDDAPRFPASLLKPDHKQVLKALDNEVRWQQARQIVANSF